MKRHCGVRLFLAAALLFATGAPALADYTITGDVSSGYTPSSLTGSLWSVLSGGLVSHSNAGSQNNPYVMDYVVVTGSGGQQMTYSVGEIDSNVAGGLSNVQIAANGSGGYNLTGPNNVTITNVSNINVAYVPLPSTSLWGNYNSSNGVSSSFNIFGPGLTATSDNPSTLPNGLTGTYGVPGGTSVAVGSTTYYGISLASLLSNAGVVTSNPNQVVVAVGSDGFEVVMSMNEITTAGDEEMIVDGASGTNTSYYYNVNNGVVTLENGGDGFARTIIGGDGSTHGLWDDNIVALEVLPTPVPPALLLMAPALAGMGLLRKRRFV